MTHYIRRLVLFVMVSLISACSFDFESPSEITDRRILGIQAQPPELTGIAPITTEVALDALVADPEGPDGMATVTWEYCIRPAISASNIGNGGGGPGDDKVEDVRCPDDLRVLIYSGIKAINALEQSFVVPNEILAVLNAGGDTPAPRLQIQLQVSTKSEDLYAVKDITITPELPVDQELNSNPQLTGIHLDGIDWPVDTAPAVPFGECTEDNRENKANSDDYQCLREMTPQFSADQAQFYFDDNPLTGDIETQREQLRFDWFTDVGNFTPNTSWQPNPTTNFPYNEGVFSRWREPSKRPESNTPSIWLVVRDGRGGISWLTRQFQIQ